MMPYVGTRKQLFKKIEEKEVELVKLKDRIKKLEVALVNCKIHSECYEELIMIIDKALEEE